MKKSLLLCALGAAGLSVNAQQAVNLSANGGGHKLPGYYSKPVDHSKIHHASTQRTTATGSYWYSYQEMNYLSAVASTGIFPIYNDSTTFIPNGTPSPFFWYIQGLGTSFDPTSVTMSPTGVQNPDITDLPTFTITDTKAYTVDSIEIVGRYYRQDYNNYVDTLNIYVVAAASANSGTAQLFLKDEYCYTNLQIPDSTIHFGDAVYDTVNNRISSSDVPSVVKVQKILDAAAFADSLSSGYHDWRLKLPTTLNAPAGSKIVAYQQYVSGHTYRFGIDIDSANVWGVLCYELNGADTYPKQLVDDANSGLLITTAARYNQDDQGTKVGGKQYLNTTYFYGPTAGFDDPWFAFHISCPTCVSVGVAGTSTAVSEVKVVPNPASSQVTISFTAAANSAATVSLTNMLGQVVASKTITGNSVDFNTAALPAGVYAYTIDANGARTTGRVVVAH